MQAIQDKPHRTALAPVHLVVLQHGLWGNTTCTSNFEGFLREHLGPQSQSSTSTRAQGASTNSAAAAGTDSKATGTEGSSTGPWFAAAAAGTADAASGPTTRKAEVQILNSDVNRKALTYDGIDVCGARVVKMVLDSIQLLQGAGRQVTQLSFVGYSLGGLILRYAVGKLYVLGLFEEVECANFITIATPHLGSWRAPTSFWARFFNSHVAVVGSRTGRQLMLVDADYTVPWLNQQQQQHEQAHAQHAAALSQQRQQQQQKKKKKQDTSLLQQQQQQQQWEEAQADLPPGVAAGQPVPLLLLMAHPSSPFHKALAGFKTRMVAANIKYDAMVPYCTAALCMTNPYEEREAVSVDPDRYPSVVRPAAVGEEVCSPLTYKGRTKRLLLFALFSPFAPLLYVWTVTYGVLHHRSARRRVLEGSWLQSPPAPAAAAATLTVARSLTTSTNSSSRAAAKQPPGSTRTAAILGTSAAGGGDAADTGEDLQGLITTAVQAGNEGAERSPFEAAMQAVAAETAAAEVPAAAQVSVAASAQQGGAASTSSRRFSDSLAAAVQHHRQEDELGQLSRQLSSKGLISKGNSLKLGFSHSGSAGVDAAVFEASSLQELNRTTAAAAPCGSALGAVHSAPNAAAAAAGVDERVTVDRDGIVEAPSLLHQQQAWMAQQLFDAMPPCILPHNTQTDTRGSAHVQGPAGVTAGISGAGCVQGQGHSSSDEPEPQQQQQQPQQQEEAGVVKAGSSSVPSGGWHRVDVCTRHWHAHAAIIIRDYRFQEQSRDVFQYLVDHMSL